MKELEGKECKTALLLLKEIVDDGNQFLCDEAISMANNCGRSDTDSIRQCYYMISKPENYPSPIDVENVPILNYNPDLSAYDSLTGGVRL